jgi:hypothetical protein
VEVAVIGADDQRVVSERLDAIDAMAEAQDARRAGAGVAMGEELAGGARRGSAPAAPGSVEQPGPDEAVPKASGLGRDRQRVMRRRRRGIDVRGERRHGHPQPREGSGRSFAAPQEAAPCAGSRDDVEVGVRFEERELIDRRQ